MIFRKGLIYMKLLLCKERYIANTVQVWKGNAAHFKNTDQIRSMRSCNVLLNYMNESLQEIGLQEKDNKNILSICPELSKLKEGQLSTSIDVLMKCQFGQQELSELVIKHPYILCVDPSKIEELFINLSSVLKKTHVYKVFLNSPEVLNEPVSKVMEKLNYLENVMYKSKEEIANSGALKHPINNIKLRHVFLDKVGVFKDVSHKLQPHEKKKINPNLFMILDTSDYEFSTKIAGVTLQEFTIFQQIFDCEEKDIF